MFNAGSRLVPVTEGSLEVQVRGSGEPVVLLQTALVSDEFLPLAQQPDLREYRVISYRRRGYGRSAPARDPGSIARDADDCLDVLDALDIPQAHIAGVSYSGAIALQVAASTPSRVRTLCVIEPPPVHIPSADEFFAASSEMTTAHRLHGTAFALDKFMRRVVGPDWRTQTERHLPQGIAQIEREADTFFVSDIPALLTWRFGPEEAKRITQPVMYIGGTESGPWFAEVRDLIRGWLPQAQDVLLEGADHSLALTHSAGIAAALTSFLHAHPIEPGETLDTCHG